MFIVAEHQLTVTSIFDTIRWTLYSIFKAHDRRINNRINRWFGDTN